MDVGDIGHDWHFDDQIYNNLGLVSWFPYAIVVSLELVQLPWLVGLQPLVNLIIVLVAVKGLPWLLGVLPLHLLGPHHLEFEFLQGASEEFLN